MTLPEDRDDACTICGRDGGSTPFCHVYGEGRRIVLCSVSCTATFVHRADPPPWASDRWDRAPGPETGSHPWAG